VKHIIEAHERSMLISTYGVGSEFSFTIEKANAKRDIRYLINKKKPTVKFVFLCT
jgi:hypothetical protein